MPRKPAARKNAPASPKSELFADGEIETTVPELSALQREKSAVAKPAAKKAKGAVPETQSYRHPGATTPLRPEAGTQDRFRQKKEPATYSYDPSLSPQLQWTGKAERLSFKVPTLPLFIHERLSTKAILETLKGHRRSDEEQLSLVENLFGDPRHSETDQLLKAYAHADQWVNRMILGDALVAMNSLLRFESLGGQVQMIYIDPPYGVKFGSNFQPFVRKRDVSHGDDADLTREPEMVQAYRDTWELGLHSYLTYLRDRLLLSRDLLHPSGSIFVQISDENLHHVRELMDEVFGAENFVSVITFQTTTGFESKTIPTLGDFLLWYARDTKRVRVHRLFQFQEGKPGEGNAKWVLLPDGSYRGVTKDEIRGSAPLPSGAKLYFPDNLSSQDPAKTPQPFVFEGKTYFPAKNSHWKAKYPEGMQRLAESGRIHVAKNSIRFRRFADDFPYTDQGNIWTDTLSGSFTEEKLYVVKTEPKVIERCMLMTTDPGDLVLDPTCGSGTTAYVAEQWGRRWITMDVSRVPLALARQRLLTASFPWFQLKDEARGPAGGFVYKRRQNKKGEEVGGIVPHITLKSIANNEPPAEEVLVDRPEESRGIVRVCGPFTVEATIPTPVDYEGDGQEDAQAEPAEAYGDFVARMIEVLRRSPVLRLDGGRTVTLKNVRLPAKSLALSAEAMMVNGVEKLAAFVFGPEHGAVSSKLVSNAAREAYQKSYAHLYVVGFAIEPEARKFVEQCEAVSGIPATYVQATPDLMMGDLLKNMRSSHIFSVCGLPEIAVRKATDEGPEANGEVRWEVELLGLDVFDPVTMEAAHRGGDDVPAWFLDTDYNGLVFKVRQAFFPRTSAWENLKKELRAEFEESVWDHLAGTISAPFAAGEHRSVAVKVIDDRGNELLVVKELK
jgi:adenine-specific DNA-methyltransferase